jgi:beta-lactam-binding protein with PASTA domain
MPDFVGQSLVNVTPLLQNAGLRLGTVTVASDSASAESTSSSASLIVTQDPAAGQRVAAGSVVNLGVR